MRPCPPPTAPNKIPTLLGNDGDGKGDYLNDHPVGVNAISVAVDSTTGIAVEVNGVITMTGANSSQFVKNYGFFVSLSAYNGNADGYVHHLPQPAPDERGSVTNGPKSGLPTGNYATMFFIRAPYNPASGTAGSNQTAQFCRQCHGGEANESNGSYTIPTTF